MMPPLAALLPAVLPAAAQPLATAALSWLTAFMLRATAAALPVLCSARKAGSAGCWGGPAGGSWALGAAPPATAALARLLLLLLLLLHPDADDLVNCKQGRQVETATTLS